MRRMTETEPAAGPLEAEAVELLRAAAPHRPPAGAKQRVRQRLIERRVGAAVRPLALRWAVVLASLTIAGIAGATLGGRWIGRGAAPAARPVPAARPAASAPTPAIVAPAAPAAEPAVEPAPAERSAPPAHRAAAARPHRPAAEPAEASLLFEATRALRRDGDARRAASVLREYFRLHPRGELVEEALALEIEVSTARGDGRAPELGRRYLARFPAGHFRANAERALARPGE